MAHMSVVQKVSFSREILSFSSRETNMLSYTFPDTSAYAELMALDDITHYANLATLRKPFGGQFAYTTARAYAGDLYLFMLQGMGISSLSWAYLLFITKWSAHDDGGGPPYIQLMVCTRGARLLVEVEACFCIQ